MKRPSREKCLMETAMIWAERGTCLRAKVGCVISIEGRILSIGYVGAPKGLPHCLDQGCIINEKTGSCMRGIHSEANAISFAARNGVKILGADLYVTMAPCISCAQIIVASGIKKVIYDREYWDISPINYLENSGIEVFKL